MPKFDEDEGIMIISEHERHKGNVLTIEQRAKGGRNGCGPSQRRSDAFYRALGQHRARIRWKKDNPASAGLVYQDGVK